MPPSLLLRAVVLVALLAAPGAFAAPQAECGPPWNGADVSMLGVLERAGAPYAERGAPADVLALLRRSGATTVRLRVWHTPDASPEGRASRLAEALALAQRAAAEGLCVGLTLHFSDTWADPAQQTKPRAWASAAGGALADSVRDYTRHAVRAFDDQGTPLAFVQLGNEITAGLLWPDGRVGGAFDTPAQWAKLGALLRAAAAGALDTPRPPRLVLHLDRGGDAAGATWFLDRARAERVPFNAVGLSYYPWWHGEPGGLTAALGAVAARYNVPVFVAETAYPWTLAWSDTTHNVVGARPLAAFEATPDGQAAFVRDVRARVAAVPGGRGAGVLYWAPEWTAAPGAGSPWENLAAFNFYGEALPALHALGETTTTVARPDAPSAARLTVWPNPASGRATARVLGVPGRWRAALIDALGRTVATFEGDGDAAIPLDLTAHAPGAYALRVVAADGARVATTPFALAPAR